MAARRVSFRAIMLMYPWLLLTFRIAISRAD